MRFRSGVTHINMACVGASVKVDCYVFARSRAANQKVFWSSNDLFQILKIVAYDGQPSKWFGICYKTWEKTFLAVFGCSQLAFSTFCSGRCTTKSATPFWQRCLPEPCFSTCGLLLMLTKWAFATPQRGGMSEASSKFAAKTFVEAMLNDVGGPSGFGARVVFAKGWQCTWPRPSPPTDGEQAVSLRIASGIIDMSPIERAALAGGARSCAHDWFPELQKSFANLSSVRLVSFFAKACGSKCMASLFAQLLWAVSLQIERVLGSMVKAGAQNLDSQTFSFDWTDTNEWDSSAIDRNVCQYVMCGAEQLGPNLMELGIATDKGWARSLSLMTTIFAKPGNFAVVAVPQAGLVQAPGPELSPRALLPPASLQMEVSGAVPVCVRSTDKFMPPWLCFFFISVCRALAPRLEEGPSVDPEKRASDRLLPRARSSTASMARASRRSRRQGAG